MFVHVQKIVLNKNIQCQQIYIKIGLGAKHGTWIQLQAIYAGIVSKCYSQHFLAEETIAGKGTTKDENKENKPNGFHTTPMS